MKKDIYIIKNSVNNKVYIGQAKNAAERWLSHLYNAKHEARYNKQTQIIHKAMNKYGTENFHYELLESQVENYDEREIYWIDYYHSRVPNGYNVAIGGNGTGIGINSPLSKFKNEQELDRCISEISSSTKTFTNIAKKYGVTCEVIIAINRGERYHREGLEYPLRQTNYRYSREKVKQVIYALKHEPELTYNDISKKYELSYDQICSINKGSIYYIFGEDYPLRKKGYKDIDYNTLDKIVNDIINSELSMASIAKKYKVSKTAITSINKGLSYRRPINYPLREENDPRNASSKKYFTIPQIKEIIALLKTDISIRQIAAQYGTTPTTINNINNGKCKKYVLWGYNYPIRDHK